MPCVHLTLSHPAAFGDLWGKNTEMHMALRGNFSGIRYRPGQSLKIRSKPCSLHSKKIFWLGIRIFF